MIKSITGQPGTSYRWEDVARPWNSIDSPNKGHMREIHFCDTKEHIDNCLNCTRKRCTGGDKCTIRLGLPKNKIGRPPKNAEVSYG